MYQIRGFKSSMDKVAYPTGKVSSIGTLMEDTSFKFQPGRDGSYDSGLLFSRDNDNNALFDLTTELVYVNRGTDSFYKSVAVQKQISNNGSLLPHNTNDRYLGPISWAGWGGNYYLNQKFKLNRNAVPFSPVNEFLILQTKLNNVIDTTPNTFGTYVDYRFNETGIGEVINIPIRTLPDVKTSIDSPDTYEIILNVTNKNNVVLYTSKNTYSSIGDSFSYFNVNGNTDICYKYIDVAISAANINTYLADMHTISLQYGARYASCVIDVTDSLKAILAKGAAKYNYVLFKIMLTSSRGYFDKQNEPLPPNKLEAIKSTMRHQSDFLATETVVDVSGDFIILKFNRPTKVDVFFDSVALLYDVFSDANNEIRVNKKTTKFTVGGVLTITQKHNFVSGTFTNRTFSYTVPDTTPPAPPTYTGATRNTISGTALAGDIVVVEKDNVVIAQGLATATNSFELILASVELSNDDILVLYTKDKAGNKSTFVNVTITDSSSENNSQMLVNSDSLNTI